MKKNLQKVEKSHWFKLELDTSSWTWTRQVGLGPVKLDLDLPSWTCQVGVGPVKLDLDTSSWTWTCQVGILH